jgi:hypothetical protein
MSKRNWEDVAKLLRARLTKAELSIESLLTGLLEIAKMGEGPFNRQSVRAREIFMENVGCLHVSKCLREGLPVRERCSVKWSGTPEDWCRGCREGWGR